MKNIICFALCCAAILSSCRSGGNKTGNDPQPAKFTIPDIPVMMTAPEDRAAFLAAHYWDNFNFSDTSMISKEDITTQALVDYLALLPVAPKAAADKGLVSLLDKASADSTVFAYFTETIEKYLYDPNSPTRNEELYVPVLEYIIASNKVDELMKTRPRFQLGETMKNRRGTKAADLTYTTPNGAARRLYNVKADFILLMFYNPGCSACRETEHYIVQSPIINRLMESEPGSGNLKIVAFYPDEDLDEWRKNLPELPTTWIVGRDAAQTSRELYDLRAIPNLYLLDKDKTVLLKDAAIEQIEEYLIQVVQAGYVLP